jgi:hypothetical protein
MLQNETQNARRGENEWRPRDGIRACFKVESQVKRLS